MPEEAPKAGPHPGGPNMGFGGFDFSEFRPKRRSARRPLADEEASDLAIFSGSSSEPAGLSSRRPHSAAPTWSMP